MMSHKRCDVLSLGWKFSLPPGLLKQTKTEHSRIQPVRKSRINGVADEIKVPLKVKFNHPVDHFRVGKRAIAGKTHNMRRKKGISRLIEAI